MRWFFSVRNQFALALAICVAAATLIWWLVTNHQHTWINWLASWLLAANLTAFVYYGLDKYLAQRSFIVRIPEFVLHSLAGVGGSPAALLAMWVFRHKTIKGSFRVVFWCIVIIQVAIIAYIVKLVWWT